MSSPKQHSALLRVLLKKKEMNVTLHNFISQTNKIFLLVCLFLREGQYRYKPGTTAVLTKSVTPLSLDVVDESVQIMDTE